MRSNSILFLCAKNGDHTRIQSSSAQYVNAACSQSSLQCSSMMFESAGSQPIPKKEVQYPEDLNAAVVIDASPVRPFKSVFFCCFH